MLLPPWFVATSTILERSGLEKNWFLEVPIRLGHDVGYALKKRLIPIGLGPHRSLALAEMPTGHPAWSPIVAAARFVASPSPQLLGEALRAVAAVWDQSSYVVSIPTGCLSWPLAECITAAKNRDDFLRLAQRAETGDLGEATDWESAEQKWSASGLDRGSIER